MTLEKKKNKTCILLYPDNMEYLVFVIIVFWAIVFWFLINAIRRKRRESMNMASKFTTSLIINDKLGKRYRDTVCHFNFDFDSSFGHNFSTLKLTTKLFASIGAKRYFGINLNY